MNHRKAFTLIELLVVIAIIAVLAVVVVVVLNPAELLRQSRDASRVSDMATLTSALNLYVTDRGGTSAFSMGNASNTYPSTYDPSATSTADQCQGLGMFSLNTSTGQAWQCSPSSTYRTVNSNGWIPVNLNTISAGSPIGNLPIDPINQTSTGLFYAYNTNGTQFETTADLESNKYHTQYANTLQTPYFPDVISAGTPGISALYNPSGLIGYWSLNEGSGTTAFDNSGNGDNAAWGGTTSTNGTYYTSGIVGNYAGNFNGVDDYLVNASLTNFASTTGAANTVSFWMNRPSTLAQVVFDFGTFTYYLNTISCSGISNGVSVYGGAPPSANQWVYVTLVLYNGIFSSNGSAIYYNGAAFSPTCSAGAATASSSNTLQMGRYSGGNDYFGGAIDDFRIYNRALSPAEIKAMYTAEL